MKNYSLVPQENENYCICSALQAVFRANGINISQREIADNLTPSKTGYIADDDKIKDFLQSNRLEYTVYNYNQTPFNEPDMVLKDMNKHEGFIGIDSHIYLLKDFNDPELQVIDPLNNRIITKDIYQTLKEMKRSEGFFGLVKILQ